MNSRAYKFLTLLIFLLANKQGLALQSENLEQNESQQIGLPIEEGKQIVDDLNDEISLKVKPSDLQSLNNIENLEPQDLEEIVGTTQESSILNKIYLKKAYVKMALVGIGTVAATASAYSIYSYMKSDKDSGFELKDEPIEEYTETQTGVQIPKDGIEFLRRNKGKTQLYKRPVNASKKYDGKKHEITGLTVEELRARDKTRTSSDVKSGLGAKEKIEGQGKVKFKEMKKALSEQFKPRVVQ